MVSNKCSGKWQIRSKVEMVVSDRANKVEGLNGKQ